MPHQFSFPPTILNWMGLETSVSLFTFLTPSDETLQQSQEPTIAMNTKPLNNNSEENVEVQIVDLRDVYDKKTQTKKGSKRLEYRLENSEVTVVVRASVEITKICAYVQRCARAAIRTHDIRGEVKHRPLYVINTYCALPILCSAYSAYVRRMLINYLKP